MGEMTLAAVPLIVGLVEVAKRAGYPERYAPLLAIGLGAGLSLSEVVISHQWSVASGSESATWSLVVLAFWQGVALGLAAVGLYHVTGRVGGSAGGRQ